MGFNLFFFFLFSYLLGIFNSTMNKEVVDNDNDDMIMMLLLL